MRFRRLTSTAAALALASGLAVGCADDTDDPIDPEPTEVAPPIDEGTPNNDITGDGTGDGIADNGTTTSTGDGSVNDSDDTDGNGTDEGDDGDGVITDGEGSVGDGGDLSDN